MLFNKNLMTPNMRCQDIDIDINMEQNMANSTMIDNNVGMAQPFAGSGCGQPIYECPTERCVHRNIVHEVPQE